MPALDLAIVVLFVVRLPGPGGVDRAIGARVSAITSWARATSRPGP